MIFGRSGTAMLATLGQTLLLTDVIKYAEGHLIVPDRVIDLNRSSIVEKRDSSDDWVEVTGWPSFELHVASCSSSDVDSDAMSITKRDSVSETTNEMFGNILTDILTINRGASDVISTLESAWDKMSSKEGLTAEENTQINFYMAMYGTFKETDSTGMDRANDRIAQLKYFTNEYIEGLDKDSFKVRIICDQSAWELEEADDQGNKEGWMFSDGGVGYLASRKSSSQSNVCQDKKGQDATLAFMFPGGDYDYMTLCDLGWERFSGATSIPVLAAKELSELEYEDLDAVAKKPADGVILHELTHSKHFWGDLVTTDVLLNDKTPAYGFEKIVELAKEGNSEGDVSKLKSLKNADTFKYWAIGAFISQCDWSTGSCIDPEDLMY